MFFSYIKTIATNFNIFNVSKKNKNSSTLQATKATNFCSDILKYLCNDISGIFPNTTPYSKQFSKQKEVLSMERTSLSALASITVEASIILPFFILILSTIIYLFSILYTQTIFQERLSEVSREISSIAYASTSFFSMNEEEQTQASSLSGDIFSDIGYSLISIPIIESKFKNSNITDFLNNSYIINKNSGLAFYKSNIDIDKNELNIVLSYSIKIPFLPKEITIPITQVCCSKFYLGVSITPAENDTDIYVYICNGSTVYHTNKYCSYLLKYVSIYPKDYHTGIPNIPCSACCNRDFFSYDTYYIVDDVNGRAHSTLDCRIIRRNIYRIPVDEVDASRHLCERCKNNFD